MEFYRFEVQKKIRELCTAGPYYAVVYDKTTLEPSALVSTPINDATDHVPPSAVEVNEISSAFADSLNKRGGYALDRSSWQFQVMLHFDREVLLEAFEQVLSRRVPIVARDAAEGRTKQITLRVLQIAYEHPTRQAGSTGTRASYVFDAQLSPH